MENFDSKMVSLSIRMTSKDYDGLKSLAERNVRSLNEQVVFLIRKETTSKSNVVE